MALSKSKIPYTAQHYLVCGTEDCEKNCQFYCNTCHRRLCEQCRYEHQKSPVTKNHEVVPYGQRRPKIPVEKCKIHPSKDIDLLCEECEIALCSKCTATQEHRGHVFTDLETVFAGKCLLCQNEISKIVNCLQPSSQSLQKEITGYATEIRKIMESIRTSIKAEAESIKRMVGEVMSDKVKQVNEIEKSLIEKLNSQNKRIDDYNNYLTDLVKTFKGYLAPSNIEELLFAFTSDNFKIQPIPDITKPVPPEFTAGQFSKEDVTKLLGRVTVPDTKPENRKMETALRKQDMEKSDLKQALSLSSFVTKVREYTVPEVNDVCHMSLDKSGRLWGSDYDGNLIQTDFQGNLLQKIQTSGGYGYHTVTQNGDLIFADRNNKVKVINRIKQDKTITEFIKSGDWTPISIHSSHINGDILVGMIKGGEAKVTRYNQTGKEIRNIKRDNKGQELYKYPHYITENINGDICTSDFNKEAVVVVNKSGQYRISYTGQEYGILPYSVCTNVLGHILACDGANNRIHFLDVDGQFLILFIGFQEGTKDPYSVLIDTENNFCVGQRETNRVLVFKYLQ